MKRIVERIEKMTDVVFSDEWQNKFFTWSFGIMCAICFIAGFWNYAHFLFAGMFGVATYITYNEKKIII